MPTPLTNEQKNAILKQSAGMTLEQKKAFATKIQGAQTKDALNTPKVTTPTPIAPVEQVKSDNVLIPGINAPKVPTPGIQIKQPDLSAQDIKSKELDNQKKEFDLQKGKTEFDKANSQEVVKEKKIALQEKETALQSAKDSEVLNSFTAAVETGNKQDLLSLYRQNPKLKDKFNALVKNQFKAKADREYFSKYSSYNNNQLLTATKTGELVVGSDKWNNLPESQRASFNELKTQDDANNALESNKKQFESDNTNILSLDSIISQLKSVFSTNLKEEYEKAMNSSEITQTAKDLETKQNEINTLNDNIAAIEDDVRKQFPNLPKSTQAALIADKQKDLLVKKNTLVNEYNSKLGTYQSMKDTAQLELDFLKYEDQQNKEVYMTALGLYETRRKEANTIATANFLAENNALAASRKVAADKEILIFEAQLKASNQKGGKYQTDKEGRLIYLLDGKSTVVSDQQGDVVFTERNEVDQYKDTVNFKDGVYYTQRTYNNGDIQNYTSDIQGNRIGPSLNTVEFIKEKEGYRSEAYLDSSGVWTVGYGFTTVNGKPVQKGDTITQIIADSELQKQIGEYTTYEKLITVELSEEQKTALNSFEYNLGKGIWDTTGSGIITAINNGDLETASQLMVAHNKARNPKTGELEEIKGLTNRRIEEASLIKTKLDITKQYSQEAQDWAKNISRGVGSLANVPANIRTEVSSALANIDITLDEDNPVIQNLRSQFKLADDIVDWEGVGTGFFGNDTVNESLLEDISGGFQTNIWDNLTGEKKQILSKIQFLLDEQPLKKLIEVKAQGATFGALSNAELALLTKSASFLNSAANRDEDTGKLTGFDMSEGDLRENLRILKDGYSKAISQRTGIEELDLDAIRRGLQVNTGIDTTAISNSLGY